MDLILRGLFQHPHLLTLCRWLLAAVFLTSAGGKLRDRRAFASIVMDYQILPKRWVRPFATVLPWVEGAVALMLLLGMGTKIGAALSGLLLFSFAFAVGLNLLRGRKDLNCGCAGARHKQKISGKILVQNTLLSLLGLPLLGWGGGPFALDGWLSSQSPTDVFVPLALIAIGLTMLYRLTRQMGRFIQMEGQR